MSEQLRVCLFAPAFPPVVGGVETFLGTLASELLRHQVLVRVVSGTPVEEELRSKLEASGGTAIWVERCPPPGAVGWEYDAFYRAEALQRTLAQYPVDVIHAASHDCAISAAIAMAALPPTRLVTAFGEIATEDPENSFGLARTRFVHDLPQIDAYLAWSRYYEELARKYEIPQHKVHRILAGVEVDLFAAGDRARGRAALGLSEDILLCCCPARFTPRKGQLELVRAVRRLRADGDGGRLRVLLTGSVNSGSQRYVEQLLREIEEAALEDVFMWRPEVPFAELPHLVAAADIVVQPSHVEGLGGAALEAMAAGRCVLLTRTRGFDEIAHHGENAWMVEPRSSEALAQGLRFLMDRPSLRAQLGRAAANHAQAKFRAESAVGRILELYLKLRDSL